MKKLLILTLFIYCNMTISMNKWWKELDEDNNRKKRIQKQNEIKDEQTKCPKKEFPNYPFLDITPPSNEDESYKKVILRLKDQLEQYNQKRLTQTESPTKELTRYFIFDTFSEKTKSLENLVLLHEPYIDLTKHYSMCKIFRQLYKYEDKFSTFSPHAYDLFSQKIENLGAKVMSYNEFETSENFNQIARFDESRERVFMCLPYDYQLVYSNNLSSEEEAEVTNYLGDLAKIENAN
jgi:hypothetical protein